MTYFSGFAPAVPALEARDLAVAPAGTRDAVLTDISLAIPGKCRAALVGANGVGKSTLLRTFAGLLKPLAGTASTFGRRARTGDPDVCFLAQRSRIDWTFPISVRELTAFGRSARKRFPFRISREDLAHADDALAKLRLSELASRSIGELSGGQQQRAMLARALCQEARLLLLDEPYVGLDARSRDVMDEILFGAEGRRLTLVMATHDLADALGHFDRILEIRDGRLRTVRACRGHEHFVELD